MSVLVSQGLGHSERKETIDKRAVNLQESDGKLNHPFVYRLQPMFTFNAPLSQVGGGAAPSHTPEASSWKPSTSRRSLALPHTHRPGLSLHAQTEEMDTAPDPEELSATYVCCLYACKGITPPQPLTVVPHSAALLSLSGQFHM